MRLDNDAVDEPDGAVTCTLLPGTGYTVSSTGGTRTLVVTDDDPTIVSLARVGSGAVDEGSTAEFTVTLGRALVAGEIVDVPLAVGGTASTADWSLALKSGGSLNTGVTLTGQATATPKLRFSGAAAQTATLVLTATADSWYDRGETVTVALGPDGTGPNGFDHSSVGTNVGGGADPHGSANEFTVTITDRTDDFLSRLDAGRLPTLDSSVSAGIALSFPGWHGLGTSGGAHRVLEGGSADHTVVLQTRPSGDVTVTIAGFSGSDVTVDADSGTAGNQNTLTFTRSNWNIPRIVTIRAAEDTDTADDSVTLSHSASGGGYSSVASQSLGVTVYDNDIARDPYTGSFVETTFVVPESDGYVTVGFTLNRPLTEGARLRFRYDDLTAISGLDYIPVESVWVPAGESRVSLRIKLVNDKGDEENELFRMYFESDSLKNWDTSQSVQLTDVIIQSPDYWSLENSDGTFTCFGDRLLHSSSQRVPATRVRDPNGVRDGFVLDSGIQVFPLPAGVEVRWDKPSYEVGDTAVVTFRTLNAERSCADVAFSLSIASQTAEQVSSGYRHFTKASADHPVGPDFRSLVTPVLRRGATEVSVPVPLQAEGRVGFRLMWSAAQAPRIPPVFLEDSDTQLADVTDGSRYWSLRIWRDVAVRTGNSPPVVPPGGQRSMVTISADRTSVTEGGEVIFTVTADPAPAHDLVVTVSADEEMGSGDDRAGGGHFGTVTIRAGTASATWTLTTMSDDDALADGTVVGRIEAGDGYTVGEPSSVTLTLLDDDGVVPQDVPDSVVGDPATPGIDPALVSEVRVRAAETKYGAAHVNRWRRVLVAFGVETYAGLAPTTAAEAQANAKRYSSPLWPRIAAVLMELEAAAELAQQQQLTLVLPEITVSAGNAVTEGGDAVFTVTANPAPASDLAVSVTVAAEGDYGITIGERPVTIPATGSVTLTLATSGDDADEPDGSASVTVNAGDGYTVGDPASGTVAVRDDDEPPPTVISVADATVTEGDGASLMWFTVRLSEPSAGPVTVRADTRPSTPVSAKPREDYWPVRSSRVSFRAGETEQRVPVYIADDNHDEDAETFELVLSAADGARIGDGVAVGTIVNDDPMPAAWLARFGRTVAEQALDGIAGRMAAPRTPGMQGAIAGQALSFGASANDNPTPGNVAAGSSTLGGTGSPALAEVAQAFGDRSGGLGPGGLGPGGLGHDAAGFGPGLQAGEASGAGFPQSQTMTARDALLGSSFSLTGAADGSGGSMAFWGRAAQGSFDGREGTFSLDGTVTTGMLGADYARGKWLVGLALAQSEGEGDYRDTGIDPRPASQTCPSDAEGADAELCRNAVRAGDGSVEASLMAAIPYAALQASERLKLWGAAGHGTGEVTLKTALGGSYKADTSWSMAAAGLRGDLLAPPAEGSGPALAVTSDALWTRTSSEKTDQLAASDSDATRLRLGLEGSYRMVLEGGGSLVPKLEVGMRHDGGDAETGFGVELGGGIAWSDPKLGMSLDVSGRTLIAHGNDDLKDRGYAAALAFDPDPATGRGPSLSLRQEFGGQAQGGLDALFAPEPLEDRTGSGGGHEATSRWAMEAAWGLPVLGGRFTGSPYMGLGLATGGRDYSLGWRLTPEAATASGLSFGLRATRRENGSTAPEHILGIEATARW